MSPKPKRAVHLLWGEDAFLLREAASALLEDGLQVTEVEAGEWRGGELADLATPSLFGDRRALVVSDCRSLPDEGMQELTRYRSEFFGRLRQILSQRSDILVVGDRFVFQAEVLFPKGQATLNPEGQAEMLKLADAQQPAAMTIATSASLGPVLDVLRATSERTHEKCESVEELRGAMKARSVIIDLLNDNIAREVATR